MMMSADDDAVADTGKMVTAPVPPVTTPIKAFCVRKNRGRPVMAMVQTHQDNRNNLAADFGEV